MNQWGVYGKYLVGRVNAFWCKDKYQRILYKSVQLAFYFSWFNPFLSCLFLNNKSADKLITALQLFVFNGFWHYSAIKNLTKSTENSQTH